MDRWRGRVVLVTGASSGIGFAIAESLYQEGMKVAVCARRGERLLELQESLQADDLRFLRIEADLRDELSIQRMFEHVRMKWGGVDVLVNNAGLGHHAPLLSGDVSMWREMLEVNVLALCHCTREAVSDMRRQGFAGHIFHISSMSAHRVTWGSGMYAATKHAVRALTEGLRQELYDANCGIRVTSISPGFVETEFAEKYHRSEETASAIYSRYKTLEAGDVADSVLYALSTPGHVQVHDLLMRPTRQDT